MGHGSVLEHATWTFVLAGVSRSFSHELVRHRVGFAFSQLSQQYVGHEDAQFVVPPHIREIPQAWDAWKRSTEVAKDAYAEITDALERAIPRAEDISRKESKRMIRSAARSVLPNATETTIVVTANARALRFFLETRGGIAGDLEMRTVSAKLLDLLSKEAPAVFSDFSVVKFSDGLPAVVKQS
jgi:thymidylate synthase (FAD)